ncbi:MAG: ABC transporter permease [Coriobacteriaceae bacterium]|nr:ABC transporter permease [Coriobacteriaceae bacterium]
MRARDVLHETGAALSANKGRTFLTMLGIIIGIVSAVVMVSIVSGFEVWLEDNMGLGAARVVTVSSEDSDRPLATDDADFLLEVCDDLEMALPVASGVTTAETSSAQSDATAASEEDSEDMLYLMGVDPDYFTMEDISLEYGALYAADSGMALILDEAAAESIFGVADASVIGRSYDIADNTFQVVGIVEPTSMLMSSLSISFAYLPYQTMCDAVLGEQTVDEILALVAQGGDVSFSAAQIAGVLAARHNISYDDEGNQDVYVAETVDSSLENLDIFSTAFNALAFLVAGIALLVGGVGIMNMMLTNVTERYREIGLRKSLGARPRDITVQFLAESVALCLVGGIIGILLGYAGAWGLVAIVVQVEPTVAGLTPVITVGLVVAVVCICIAIGIIFGIYPARRAAKLNPAETLRYQ